MRFKINDEYNLHNGFFLNLKPGYTALVGPNGAGKTTLLRQINDYAISKNIPVIDYSNLTDGGYFARQKYLDTGFIDELCTAVCSSEGQELYFHFCQFVTQIGDSVRNAKVENTKLFILLDGLDSGLSIDIQRKLLDFFKLIEKDINLTPDRKADPEVYLIVAVNSYELATGNCIDVQTGKSISFKSYDEYAKFICEYNDTHKKSE